MIFFFVYSRDLGGFPPLHNVNAGRDPQKAGTGGMAVMFWHIRAIWGEDIFTFGISSVSQGFKHWTDSGIWGDRGIP